MLTRFRYHMVLILALVGLAGCATQIDPSIRRQIHTIGVASLLGEDIHLQFKGTTIFGNRSADEYAPEFALNMTGEQTAMDRLKPSYQVANVGTVARTSLPSASFKSALFKMNCYYWHPEATEIAATVREICASRRLDALVVIYPEYFSTECGENRGVGLYGANTFGIKGFAASAAMGIAVYNNQGVLLYKETSIGLTSGLKEANISEFGWQDRLALYTPEQRKILIEKVQNLVRCYTHEMLADTGL